MFVRVRKQDARIESAHLKQLVKFSRYRKRRWSYDEENGVLILEAF